MTVFVDTSALFALLDADDLNHTDAKVIWQRLLADRGALWTTSYVLVESHALVQRRLGLAAVEVLATDIVPILSVAWIGKTEHEKGVAVVLAAQRRQLSLVDCTSFEAMRARGIERCFAFDPHFREQGFDCLDR